MSYRNPALITPASNQVFLDSINDASKSLKRTGEKIVEKKEKAKVKEAQNDKFLIELSNKKEANAATFGNSLVDMTDEMSGYMTKEFSGLNDRAFEILKEQQVNGNTDPALSKELAQINLDMKNINGLSEDIFGVTSVLQEMIANRDQVGKTLFIKEDEDGKIGRNEAIIYGFGGVEDYKRGMKKVDGKTMAYVITPDNKEYVFDPLTFKSLVSDLTMEHVNAAGAQYDAVAETIFKPKSTDFQAGMVLNTRSDNEIIDGRISNNQIQELDKAKIDRAKDLAFDTDRVALQTAKGFKQSVEQTLIDLRISLDDWNDADGDETKENKLIKKASTDLFMAGIPGLKAIETYDEKGNVIPGGTTYERVIRGAPRNITATEKAAEKVRENQKKLNELNTEN
tara:strand:- start:3500 stop:4690 length:1191 start_codon:yes stop_codon:yes gene_type:complete